jgi:FAD/FMN-containing dehydrogenase
VAIDRRDQHKRMAARLHESLAGNTQPIRIKKRGVSNLFRYDGRVKSSAREIDLSDFNQPLYLDTKHHTLEVQGLTTFEAIADFTLAHGLAPMVTPELKHITIGGATVGIGIETNSFRYGFVHDNLLEAEVLLPDGRIVVCTPDNEHADLFKGLANSYGTFGYILRAKIKLHPVKRFVQLVTIQESSTKSLVAAMNKSAKKPSTEYIESLIYSKNELYLTIGKGVDEADDVASIYGQTVFYRLISQPGTIYLPIKEYLFRYDPEWFWALPETNTYRLFRGVAPRIVRNSKFYTKYVAWQNKLGAQTQSNRQEKLIQDWEVPWKYGVDLLNFALDNLSLDGKPLLAAPTKTVNEASLYPMPPGKIHLNLGSYSFVERKPDDPPYHYTKIMDEFCFSHDGIKMLYSTTFLNEKKFNQRYGGETYKRLKAKYDPLGLAPTLYQKAVQGK